MDSATRSVQDTRPNNTFTVNNDLYDSLIDGETMRTGFETADGTLARGHKRRRQSSSHSRLNLRKSGDHMRSYRSSESPHGRASARRCSVCSLKDLNKSSEKKSSSKKRLKLKYRGTTQEHTTPRKDMNVSGSKNSLQGLYWIP